MYMYKHWFNLLACTLIICTLKVPLINCLQDDNENHKVLNNYGATALHDGYLRFGNDSTFTLPLKKKWSHSKIQCQPASNAVFVNNTYYCITLPHYTIAAVNPLNGELKWTTDFGVAKGLLATSNGMYLASYPWMGEEDPSHIQIIDALNGQRTQYIPVPANATLWITADKDIFYAFLGTVQQLVPYQGPAIFQLLTIDPAEQTVDLVLNITLNIIWFHRQPLISIPTLCSNGEVMILSDRTHFLSGYNTTTWEKIWEKNVTDNPLWVLHTSLMCLESNSEHDNDRILFGDSIHDVLTGKELSKPFKWAPAGDLYLQPMFNVDKQILIGYDLVAYDLSNTNHPEVIWNITFSGSGFIPMIEGIIVDDFVIMVNMTRDPIWQEQTVMIDINDGSVVWKSDIVEEDDLYGFGVTPGVDENGNAILITTYAYHNTSGIVFMDAYQ